MADESLTFRNLFGKYASTLAIISTFVNFAGFGALGFSMVGFPFSGFEFPFPQFPPPEFIFMQNVVISMMTNMAIKGFTGFVGPILGTQLIQRQRRTAALFYYFVIGVVTMIPIMIGGPEMLATVLASIGTLPFLPHVVGGILCIMVAALVGLWEVAPSGYGVEPLIRTVDHTYTSPNGTQLRCPVCGHGLFGDEHYCPGCAHDLRMSLS